MDNTYVLPLYTREYTHLGGDVTREVLLLFLWIVASNTDIHLIQPNQYAHSNSPEKLLGI